MTTECGFLYDGLWLDGLANGLGRFVIANLPDQSDREWRRGFPDDAGSLFDTCVAEDSQCHACLFHYAQCHMHGYGINKVQSKAMEILQKLHAFGHCDLLFWVACSIESSQSDDVHDLRAAQARAFEIFYSTAQKGHAPSQMRAALCLDAGRGVIKSEKAAFTLLLQLASHGHAVALYHIGVYYECGSGISPVYAKCTRWLKWSSLLTSLHNDETINLCARHCMIPSVHYNRLVSWRVVHYAICSIHSCSTNVHSSNSVTV
jgi:TPR repeat protein